MSTADIGVILGGLAAVVFVTWFFFGKRRAELALLGAGGVQEVNVLVQGGYSPSVIRARPNVPLRIHFDRREGTDCSSRVIFADFDASAQLAPFATTTLEFTPDRTGEFPFTCGMSMLHGTLIVSDDDEAVAIDSEPVQAGYGHTAADSEEGLPLEHVEIGFHGGGTTCPTCVTNIERVVGDLRGVDGVSVNFATERVTVDYRPDAATAAEILQTVRGLGYRAEVRDAATPQGELEDREAAARRDELRDLRRRIALGALLSPVIFLGSFPEWFGSRLYT